MKHFDLLEHHSNYCKNIINRTVDYGNGFKVVFPCQSYTFLFLSNNEFNLISFASCNEPYSIDGIERMLDSYFQGLKQNLTIRSGNPLEIIKNKSYEINYIYSDNAGKQYCLYRNRVNQIDSNKLQNSYKKMKNYLEDKYPKNEYLMNEFKRLYFYQPKNEMMKI